MELSCVSGTITGAGGGQLVTRAHHPLLVWWGLFLLVLPMSRFFSLSFLLAPSSSSRLCSNVTSFKKLSLTSLPPLAAFPRTTHVRPLSALTLPSFSSLSPYCHWFICPLSIFLSGMSTPGRQKFPLLYCSISGAQKPPWHTAGAHKIFGN